MNVITYSLKDTEAQSDNYYKEAAAFADEVLSMIADLSCPILEKYAGYLAEKHGEEPYAKEEYGFEFLILGTLWQIYSGDANGLDNMPGQLLTRLSELRKQGGTLKPGIDLIRGIMATIFLSPDLDDNKSISDPSLEYLDKLLNWLEASGEFNREVKRLRRWQSYMVSLPEKEASDILATAIILGVWFEDRSEEALGRFTKNVDKYLNEVRPSRYWREDVIFCGRRRVEYHLNMVGAEIMNRIFRKDFLATSKKVVIIPACMRFHSSLNCKAGNKGDSLHCTCCTPGCNANKLKALGKKHNFKVLMIPHESSLSSSKTEKPLIWKDTGVVGVACVLNLISGGWMMKDMGIPVQCVILDGCGCKNHWSSEGFPTEININQLKKILDI